MLVNDLLLYDCNWFIRVLRSTISAVSAWLYLPFVLIVFSVFYLMLLWLIYDWYWLITDPGPVFGQYPGCIGYNTTVQLTANALLRHIWRQGYPHASRWPSQKWAAYTLYVGAKISRFLWTTCMWRSRWWRRRWSYKIVVNCKSGVIMRWIVLS